MEVEERSYNVLCLEYWQDRIDADYGSCLWARFYFNLDKFELSIQSDCGYYGYKWPVTKSETFFELLGRINKYYFKEKLCGQPSVFDYDKTKEVAFDWFADHEESELRLDRIFRDMEDDGEPSTGLEFVRMFEEYDEDSFFSDIFELPAYRYTADQNKICQVFTDYIQPKIRDIVKREHVETY